MSHNEKALATIKNDSNKYNSNTEKPIVNLAAKNKLTVKSYTLEKQNFKLII